MDTIRKVPFRSHPQPAGEIPLQNLPVPDTGISDGDDRSNPLNEAPILAACRNNNLIWLRELLAEDPILVQRLVPSGITNNPVSPLHVTAQGGYVEASECLLDMVLKYVPVAKKADVIIPLMALRVEKDGATPFYVAAENAREMLIATFLRYLLQLPEQDIARALVAVMAAARKDGHTPLSIAVRRCDYQVVNCCLRALRLSPEAERADTIIAVLSAGNRDKLPLLMAAAMGNNGIVGSLLETVSWIPASKRSTLIMQVVNVTDSYGATPLFIAACKGFIRIIRDILAITNEVPQSKRAELVNALVNTANKNRKTPLYVAASRKNTAIVSLLLAHGADPEQAKVHRILGICRRSKTPIQIARQRGDKGTVTIINKAIQLRNAAKR